MTDRGNPLECTGGDPPMEIESVRPAVECRVWFEQPGFRRHRRYRPCGDIRGVDSEYLHAAAEP